MSNMDAQVGLTVDEAIEMLTAPGRAYEIEEQTIFGTPQRVFAHIPQSLAEYYAQVARYDERTFLVYEDERYSYAEYFQRVRSLAHRLRDRFAVQPGDRVALAMRNYPEWCITYMAATAIGAVIVPLNAWWKGAELLYAVDDSGARLVVADGERMETLLPLLSGAQELIVVRARRSLPGCVDMSDLLGGRDLPWPEVQLLADSDASILYTSGSTGNSKGVVSTHRAILSAVFAWDVGRVALGIVCDPVSLQRTAFPAPLTKASRVLRSVRWPFHAGATCPDRAPSRVMPVASGCHVALGFAALSRVSC